MTEVDQRDYQVIARDIRGEGTKPFVGLLLRVGSVIAPYAGEAVDAEIVGLMAANTITPEFAEDLALTASRKKAPIKVKIGALRMLAMIKEFSDTPDDYLRTATVIVQAKLPEDATHSDHLDCGSAFFDFVRNNGVCGRCKGRLRAVIRSEMDSRPVELKDHVQAMLLFMQQIEDDQTRGLWPDAPHNPTYDCPCLIIHPPGS